jgi:DNA-binding transcriptional regulator YhcF (GntR family)
MPVIGSGRHDPRLWVKAAYYLTDVMETWEPSRRQLPTRSSVAAKLDMHDGTVERAYRELVHMGIIYRVDGHGYFRNVSR